MGVKPRPRSIPKIDITDRATFNVWWTARNLPDDAKVLASAIEAKLVWVGESSLLWLTEKGRQLRYGGAPAKAGRPVESRLKFAAPTKGKRK